MDIKDLISLMWRNAKYIILGLVLGACIGFIVSMIQTPVYEATTRVFISRASPQSNSGMLLLDDEQLMAINLQLAKSQAVMDDVSIQLGSGIDQNNIQVTAIPNTQILKINVRDPDPQRAATIANLFVQTLIQQNDLLLSGRFTVYDNAITAQIDEVQKQIEGLHPQINQITGTGIQEQLAQVNLQIEQLQTKITGLEQEIASFPYLPSTRQLISISEIKAQLDQLHSLMTLYQEVQTNLTYMGMPSQNGSSIENPRLKALQTTLDAYQQINSTLLDNRENARLMRLQSRQNVMQIVSATPPPLGFPVLPMPALYFYGGAMVGLLLAIIAILIIDHMDDSLKSAGQIEDLLGIPVLGFVYGNKPTNNGLAISYDSASAETEAFRSLGASLEISGGGKGVSTLMIVNADPADGKTSIAANLGVIMAQQGKRVILLDGDTRHPHLHSLLGMENQIGFADLINGSSGIRDACQAVGDVKGMTLISGGITEKDSTAWLDPETWDRLLLDLQRHADLVIVDGPRADAADTQILASKMKAVLLAIRSGHTRSDSAQATLRRFQLIGARVTGAVLNSKMNYRIGKQFFTKLNSMLHKMEKPVETDDEIETPAVPLL
jgi:succinoglycan biosynthesis transport protein ExoP